MVKFYLKKFFDFLNDQFFDFLVENLRPGLDELVVDVLQTLQACLFFSLSDLTEKSSSCSQWVELEVVSS